jgi:predicted AAA+ superfamily ATPase
MILRTKYLNDIIPFIDKKLIKVLIGVRRSGKTVLLNQIKDYIINKGVPEEQFVYLNFESFINRKYSAAEPLYEFVSQKSKALKEKRLYLFFDEIQEVELWQKAINSFAVDFDCDIYITGSNSKMLSGELATYIAGRYVHFDIYPFTFAEAREYAEELGRTLSDEELFNEYLQFGGLPQCLSLEAPSSKQAYLDDVFDTIVVKDIISRNKISDISLLKNLTAFLLDNVGNPFSANSICNKLKSQGINTTVATLTSYISAIQNALIVQTAKRYDIKGKALLTTNEKYYATDLGLRNNIKSSEVLDYNKLFENIVFNEMLSRGYEVTVGKIGDYEIDFICYKKQKTKLYIQVAYLLADESVIEREFRPYRKIDDNYPKYVISADKFDFSRDGIKHKNIISFLLDG